jgi:hypothetical protein
VLLEVLVQTFTCNVVLLVVGYSLIYFGMGDDQSFLGYGMLPAIFIFIWNKVALNPE